MAEMLITMGWVADGLCLVWLIIILLDILVGWVPAWKKKSGWLLRASNRLALIPVNMMRRTIPTMYRGIDFAPWITVLALVLIKTFACRAVIYWGMLHRT